MSQTAIDPIPETMHLVATLDDMTYQRLFRWLHERREFARRYVDSGHTYHDLRNACINGVKECNKEIMSLLSIPIQ